MTNEETKLSIDYLKEMQEEYIEGEGYERHPLPEWYALDYAIKVLEQQPCEDCISRQAVLDIIMPYCQDDDGSVENTGDLRNALDDIESLPTVTPKQQPCDDCRNCKKWNECPCGKKGHENGTSIGYSIGECKNYEPCEDCISREAVNDGFKKYENGSFAYGCVRDYINELPPITPKEKTGKWINEKWHGLDLIGVTCSNCNVVDSRFSAYCPNCGAKMEVSE